MLSACCRFSASPPQSRTAPWCAHESVSLWAFSTFAACMQIHTHSPTTCKFQRVLRGIKTIIFLIALTAERTGRRGGGGGGGGGLAANPLCARCLRWWECGDYLALMRARKLVRQRLLNQQQQQRCNPQSIILLQTNNPRCPLRLVAGKPTISPAALLLCVRVLIEHIRSGPSASRLNVGARRDRAN